MTTAWVGIGANLGDPEQVVRTAIRALGELGAVCASSLYRTEPQGDANQPWFVNAVVGLESGPDLETTVGCVRIGLRFLRHLYESIPHPPLSGLSRTCARNESPVG